MLTKENLRETVFITPNGPMEIRLSRSVERVRDLCDAAQTLKARYFVAQDGWDLAAQLPIWGVFDMRTALKNTPVPGEWSINDPIRTFVTETNDPAVMFALTKGKR